MQTFGAFLIGALAASGELASALPSQMDQVRARAAGTGSGSGSGSYTVNVRPRAATTYKHPALAMAKAVNKFQAEMPTHLSAIVKAYRGPSTTKRSSGSVTTTPESLDEAYLTNVEIGTPAQTLPLDFDTGSSDLWVFSSLTPSSSVNGQKTYDVTTSSTTKKLSGASWSISYGDGSSSSGDVYMDTVSIGNLTVSSQAVEAATSVSDEFTSDSSNSGLVGLGMSTLNTVTPNQQKTWFDNIKSSLDSELFVANLNHDTAGTYTFGTMDFSGTVYYANLYNTTESLSGYWTFQASGYAVGTGTTATTTSSSAASTTSAAAKKSHNHQNEQSSESEQTTGAGFGPPPSGGGGAGFFGKARSLRASKQHAPVASAPTRRTVQNGRRAVTLTDTTITGIADTGTTLLMLPDAVVEAYYAEVTGAEDSTQEGGWVFPCDSSVPDFSFGVGDGAITIPGDYINWAAVDTTNTTCYGGIQSDSSIGFAIFGDIALKAAYVVFDGGEGRVGWAQKASV